MKSLSYLKKYSFSITIAITFLCVETYADLMQPMLLSKVVDEGLKNNQQSLVVHYGLLMLLATSIGLVGALMRNWISSHVSYAYARDLREGLFNKLMTLRTTEVDELERGSLVTRLTVDVNMIQQFINGLMRIFLKAPLLAIGSFFMVRQLDSRFLIVYLILIPIVIGITLIQLKIGYPLYDRIQTVLDRINQQTMEFLGGLRTVRAFNRFSNEKESFDAISHELAAVTTKTMRIMSLFGPLIMLTINLSIVFVIYFGKNWYLIYGVGIGQLIAFSNYMTQFYFAMSIISRVFTIFVRAKASVIRIDDIFNQQGNLKIKDFPSQKSNCEGTLIIPHTSKSTSNDTIPKAIEVNHLHYRYGKGIDTIKDISFSLEAGQRLGIIGATGSGKSTLIQLLQGILTLNAGSIQIFGRDLQSLTQEEISQTISYVPQKVTLFTGTVIENLSWGKRNLSNDDYLVALQIAQARTFVEEMELGLHAQIGRNGIQLSGGQKQRLSLARAIISRPKILILDDVTSAVDIITERTIKNNLKHCMQGELTTILVAQKITSVMDLEKIMILDEGQLIALGTHESLLATSRYYQELFAAEMGIASVIEPHRIDISKTGGTYESSNE